MSDERYYSLEEMEESLDRVMRSFYGRTFRPGEVVLPTKSDPGSNGSGFGQVDPFLLIKRLLEEN